MSVFYSPNGDQWDGETGQVIGPGGPTQQQIDDQLIIQIKQLGNRFVGLLDFHRRRGDLAVAPGADALRIIAHETYRLAADLQARAEGIDEAEGVRKPTLPTVAAAAFAQWLVTNAAERLPALADLPLDDWTAVATLAAEAGFLRPRPSKTLELPVSDPPNG